VTDRELLRSEKEKSVVRASKEAWSKGADVVENLLFDRAPVVPALRGVREQKTRNASLVSNRAVTKPAQ